MAAIYPLSSAGVSLRPESVLPAENNPETERRGSAVEDALL
jgi:hypothetical protein